MTEYNKAEIVEMVIGAVIMFAYIILRSTGHIPQDDMLISIMVGASVIAIFGHTAYKELMGGINDG